MHSGLALALALVVARRALRLRQAQATQAIPFQQLEVGYFLNPSEPSQDDDILVMAQVCLRYILCKSLRNEHFQLEALTASGTGTGRRGQGIRMMQHKY